MTLDPAITGRPTAVVVNLGASALALHGGARALTVTLPADLALDVRATTRRCGAAQARRGACPAASAIGFGRSVIAVTGFLSPAGTTEVAWSLAAYLGPPARAGDAASVVLVGKLLGGFRVTQLLQPLLGAGVPPAPVVAARLRSGAAGLRLELPAFPGSVPVPGGVTAARTAFGLSLSATRRVRVPVTHVVRVPSPTGVTIRRVADHRLRGHLLFTTPSRCSGAWNYRLAVHGATGVTTTDATVPCLRAAPLR